MEEEGLAAPACSAGVRLSLCQRSPASIDLQVAIDRGIDPVARLRAAPRGGAHRAPERLVGQQPARRFGHAPRRRRPDAGIRPRRPGSPRGTPPTREAMTGTPHDIASSAARPKLSVSLGSRKRSASRSTSGSSAARPGTPRRRETRAPRPAASMRARSGPSPTRQQPRGRAARTSREDRDHVVDPLERSKVRDVHEHRRARAAVRSRRGAGVKRSHVDEVRDDLDRASARERPGSGGSRRPATRGRVTASLVAIEKRVSGRKLGSLPTSVMSVPCSVVTTRGAAPPSAQHLAREVGADGVRHRVVRVDQVQPVAPRDLDDLRRQRQRVRRVLELRVAGAATRWKMEARFGRSCRRAQPTGRSSLNTCTAWPRAAS